MAGIPSTALARFLLLYAALYAAFGAQSPFLPSFFAGRGIGPQAIAVVLAAGTAIRISSGPLAGWLVRGLPRRRHPSSRSIGAAGAALGQACSLGGAAGGPADERASLSLRRR